VGQRSDEIKKQIDTKRSELSENLEQLEQRVKNTTDWRVQFDKRPMVMLGVAFGAGLLASALIPIRGRSRKNRTSSYSGYTSSGTGSYPGSSAMSQAFAGSQGYSGSSEGGTLTGPSRQPSATRREMRKTWSMLDDIRASLIALGSSRLKDYLGDMIPGFQDHYRRTAESRGSQQDERPYSTSYSEPDPSHSGSQQGRRTQGNYPETGYSTPGASTHTSHPVQETFSTGTRSTTGTESHTEGKSSSKPKQTR
jgi:hypothetical protein